MTGQEYNIRKKQFEKSGYRSNFIFDEDDKSFLSSLSSELTYIENEDYNFEYSSIGKIGISLEFGFIHIWFEECKFSDEDSEKIVGEFYRKLTARFGNEIEYFRT